jgi:hypothetical protein
MSAAEIKSDLRDLYITAAKQVDVSGGKKAIVIFVPFRLLKSYHKIQQRLVRELEKKFRYCESLPSRVFHAVSYCSFFFLQWQARSNYRPAYYPSP